MMEKIVCKDKCLDINFINYFMNKIKHGLFCMVFWLLRESIAYEINEMQLPYNHHLHWSLHKQNIF